MLQGFLLWLPHSRVVVVRVEYFLQFVPLVFRQLEALISYLLLYDESGVFNRLVLRLILL